MPETDFRSALHEAAAGSVDPAALDVVRTRAAQRRRRRSAVRSAAFAVPLLVALGVAATGVTTDLATTPLAPPTTERSVAPRSPREENQRIIETLPPLDGTRFISTSDVQGPPGGSGVTTHLLFLGVEDNFDPAPALDAYREALADWELVKEEHHKTRSSLVFAKGDAWLMVSTTPGAIGVPPGYTVALNAVDGRRFRK